MYIKFPGCNVSLSPVSPLLPPMVLLYTTKRTCALVDPEDSDVPQQCARARSLFFYE